MRHCRVRSVQRQWSVPSSPVNVPLTKADFQFVEIQREDLKKSPHIDKSPFGLMPYLEDTDNGKVIIESRAIARCESSSPHPVRSENIA